jgi:hypothetical protein
MPTCPSGHESASSDFCDLCGMRIDGAAPAVAPAVTGSVAAASPAATPPATAGPACPQCGAARSGQFCEACGFDFKAGQAPRPDTTSSPGAASPGAASANAAGASAAGSRAASSGIVSSGAVGAGAVGPGAVGASAVGASAVGSGAIAWTALVTADRAYYDRVVAVGDLDAGSVKFPDYCPERRFSLTAPEMRIGRHSASRGLQPEIDLTGPPTDPGVSRLHAVLIAEPDGSWIVIDPGSENGTLVNDKEVGAGVRVPLRHGDRIHLGAWTLVTIQAS